LNRRTNDRLPAVTSWPAVGVASANPAADATIPPISLHTSLLGLRREEVGGLRWSDVTLEAGMLRIRQARVDVNGRDTIVATKTERSARDLPLPPRELAMLKAMRTAHLRERLAVGRPLADDDCCFRGSTALGCPFANAPASSPPTERRQGSRQSRSASCGTRISRGCARRASPPMWLWSPPGTVTPSG
jgi:integrase